MATVDVSELRTLARDLEQLHPKTVRKVPGVVKRGAVNIKKMMQSDFGGSRSFGHIAKTVTFDVVTDAGGVGANIGPDKARGGGASLAHIAYWGGARGGGGTVRTPEGPLMDEADGFEKALGDLLDGVL